VIPVNLKSGRDSRLTGISLAGCAADAARRLTAAGISAEDSRRDAMLLARWRLGWSAATWLARANEPVPPGFDEGFIALITRRARREPLAYITGEREFYGRVFTVTPDVLIPRPETELLVEQALGCLQELTRAQAGEEATRVLDVGTGSGCVAITLALEAATVHVTAIDVSEAALRVAHTNAQRLGVSARIGFRTGSVAGDVPAAFDLVVANPPYVPEVDRNGLAPEVRDYEPAAALFAGAEGLDVIRQLVPSAEAALRPGGWLVMEIGHGQAEAVRRLMEQAGRFSDVRLVNDLQSIPRVIMGHVSLLPHRRG
jgi:release factor glutamine methyltransferase